MDKKVSIASGRRYRIVTQGRPADRPAPSPPSPRRRDRSSSASRSVRFRVEIGPGRGRLRLAVAGAVRVLLRRSCGDARPGRRRRHPGGEAATVHRRARPARRLTAWGRFRPPGLAGLLRRLRWDAGGPRRAGSARCAPERQRTFATPTYLSPILLRVELRRMGERYVHVGKVRSRSAPDAHTDAAPAHKSPSPRKAEPGCSPLPAVRPCGWVPLSGSAGGPAITD